jgi:SAM-dependent methyltransferase
MLLNRLKKGLKPEWELGMVRADTWAGEELAALKPEALLDLGCGDGAKLLKHLKHTPRLLCGVEASPTHKALAEQRGIQVTAFDLNGPWPYGDGTFDVVHSGFLIEHLHHTRMFVSEAFRVLKPGGTVLITSENLCSLLNWGAMTLGYTPFTLVNCCGWYLGNPFGLYAGEESPKFIPVDHPAFPGVAGHVRALSVPQAKELFEKVGFQAESRSIGMLPFPGFLGRMLEKLCPRRGHFLLIKGRKPVH